MNCTACGTALPEGALFCGECGRAVEVSRFAPRPPIPVPAPSGALALTPDARLPVPSADDSEFTCPQCGEAIDEDDIFCGSCGFVLSVSEPRPVLSSLAPDLSDAARGSSSRDTVAIDPVVLEAEPGAFDSGPVEGEQIRDADPGDEVEVTEFAPSAAIAEESPPRREELPPRREEDVLEVSAPRVVEPEPVFEPEPVADVEPVAVAPVVDPAPPVEFVSPVVERSLPGRDALFGDPAPKPLRKVPDPFPWGKDPREANIDLEATRVTVGASPEERFVLQFSTGESVTVSGAGLVGRNPSAQPGEFVDQLVPIFDAGKSVSKTHLEFGQDSGRFWVSDRYSTNGSTVRQPDTEPKRCEPGRRYFVARGTRVDIGEQFFVVS